MVVHDAGAEPRQVVRLALSPGETQHAEMTMRMGMALTVNGRKAPSGVVPPMRVGLDVSIVDVSADGDVSATFRYGSIDVLGSGTVAEQVRTKLAPLAKLRGTLRTTASGVLLESHLDLPDDLDPVIRQTLSSLEDQLGSLVVPVPTAPVGVGATWTVHNESELNGLRTAVDYDYQLVERRGDQLTLATRYVQSMQEQQVQLPTVPAGVETQVHPSRVTGSGRTVVDLGSALPVESSLRARGPIRMSMEQDGQQFDLVQRMSMEISLSR